MHHTGGPGWRITVDSYEHLLVALYVCQAAGLLGVGTPALSPLTAHIRPAEHNNLLLEHGGLEALRSEWDAWWAASIETLPRHLAPLVPPDFEAFAALPALRAVLQAHYGSALAWAKEQSANYQMLAGTRETLGGYKIIAELVQNREMELGRSARDFALTIAEIPLVDSRAWYVEPNKLLMSHTLLDNQEEFRSYVQPVINFLV